MLGKTLRQRKGILVSEVARGEESIYLQDA